jgi:hypothetical protein
MRRKRLSERTVGHAKSYKPIDYSLGDIPMAEFARGNHREAQQGRRSEEGARVGRENPAAQAMLRLRRLNGTTLPPSLIGDGG